MTAFFMGTRKGTMQCMPRQPKKVDSPAAGNNAAPAPYKEGGARIITQRDLARAAGVSMTTVYNALHKRTLVKERTRRKIFDLMREHDYVPDAVARSMVRQKTDVIGIVVPALEVAYYAKIVSAIERNANAAGYHCIISQHLDDPHKEEREVTMMRQRRVDGLVIRNCGQAVDAGLFQRLVSARMPLVLLGGREEGLDQYFVGGNDRQDVKQAVEWLIRKGHRRIAHLAWYRTPGDFHSGPRYLGYRDALEAHSIPYDPALVEMCQTEYRSGRLELLNILRRTADNPPTAVMAFNDHTAIGAWQGLKEAGLRIPQDVALLGHGGYLDQSAMPLSITTVEESIEEIGRTAFHMLLSQMNEESENIGPHLISGRLVEGAST